MKFLLNWAEPDWRICTLLARRIPRMGHGGAPEHAVRGDREPAQLMSARDCSCLPPDSSDTLRLPSLLWLCCNAHPLPLQNCRHELSIHTSRQFPASVGRNPAFRSRLAYRGKTPIRPLPGRVPFLERAIPTAGRKRVFPYLSLSKIPSPFQYLHLTSGIRFLIIAN